jgi:hypothetical protein
VQQNHVPDEADVPGRVATRSSEWRTDVIRRGIMRSDTPCVSSTHPKEGHMLTRRTLLTHIAGSLIAAVALPALAAPEPAGPTDLKPGQFLWHPEISPAGPIVLVVSLDEQRAYVYRNGIAIGLSTISSGKAGHETPTGVFTILQKDKDHKSNLYNSAPMPYMQRLTWDGIALHGGNLPGHPASHGCVRLPQAFAQKLFGETKRGDTVVVADARVHR